MSVVDGREAQRGSTAANSHAFTNAVVVVGLFYVAAAVLQFLVLDVHIWHQQVIYVAGVLCAVVGRRYIVRSPLLARYMVWALVLCAWVFLSSVAAWSSFSYSLHYGRIFIAIFAVLVPAFASLSRKPNFRNALVGGFEATVAFLAVVVALRIARGAAVYTLTAGLYPTLYGTGRNAINAVTLATLPLLIAKEGPRLMVRLRWPVMALGVFMIVASGGRSGLAGLVFAAVVYLILQPGIARKLRTGLITLACALVVFVGIEHVGGQVQNSYQRVVLFLHGTRTTDEEIRTLVLHKAWQLAVTHPVFGVGYGRFTVESSPVVEQEAQTDRGLEQAGFRDAHNAYAQLMAETGFPGFLFFLGLLLFVLRRAWHLRSDLRVRLCMLAVLGMMFQMLVMNLSVVGPLFIPLGLLLGSMLPFDVERTGREMPARAAHVL